MAQPEPPAAGKQASMKAWMGPVTGAKVVWWRSVLGWLGLAAAYFLLAQLNLLLSNYLGSAMLFWPPGGLALAVLLLFGPRVWPGITLGALLVIGLTGQPWPAVLVGVVANTVFPLLAAWAIRRWDAEAWRLARVRDAIAFVLYGAVAGPLGSACLGLVGFAVSGGFQHSSAVYELLHWWLGDALGVLLVAPPVLAWAKVRRTKPEWRDTLIASALVVVTLLLLGIVFGSWWGETKLHLPLAFLLLPLIAWAALRYGLRGAAAINVVICWTAAWSTDQGFGPFALVEQGTTTEFIWLFIAVCCLTALFTGAAVEAQRTLVRQLERALAEVHELKGLLPICANCKQIRDDQGYWQSVEGYISERSAAQFTHSICPACAAKLYPELDLSELVN